MLTAEELVAELRAAFLCAEFGFDGDLRVRAMSRLGSTYCEPTSGVQKGAGSYRLSAWPRAARPLPNGGIRWWRLFSARYLQGYQHRGTKTSGLELYSEVLVDIPVGSGGRDRTGDLRILIRRHRGRSKLRWRYGDRGREASRGAGRRETNLIRIKEVSASRGKAMRTEPVSLLYEKHACRSTFPPADCNAHPNAGRRSAVH